MSKRMPQQVTIGSIPSDVLDRYAFYVVYKECCAYCGRPLHFRDLEIEHILPQHLSEDPAKWSQLLQQFALPPDFDVDCDENRIASCGGCNGTKGGAVLLAAAILLNVAAKMAPKVRELRQSQITQRQQDLLLAKTGKEMANNPSFREQLFSLLKVEPPEAIPHSTAWEDNVPLQRIRQIFGAVSTGLLDWPQNIEAHWFDRPELTELKKALSADQARLILLLGPPGSGKSALLARLGSDLLSDGHSLLAVKADLLHAEIASLRDLDARFELPAPLPILVERLAQQGQVVILIDQLDALSELMDKHSERLVVLLALVDRLRLISNVTIIVTCREFDAEYDLRLRRLANSEQAKTFHLKDVPWPSVCAFLIGKGFRPDPWPESAKQVLVRPNALKLFLKHFTPHASTPTFSGYHAMLEEILEQTVIRPHGSHTVEVLYALADDVSQREELWVPQSTFKSRFRPEVALLQSAGWIQLTSDQLRLGFSHQTLYDFIRSRSFLSPIRSLSTEIEGRQNGLAVRSVLLSAAIYLRNADRSRYLFEIGALLRSSNIRPHIRILLIDFLSDIQDPTREEAGWLRPLLMNGDLRPHILSTAGKTADWFALMRNAVVGCADFGIAAAQQAAWVLNNRLDQDWSFVFDALETSWLLKPELDRATFDVFRRFQNWDERSAKMIETMVARTSFSGWWMCDVASRMARNCPRHAARIVWVMLDQNIQSAKRISRLQKTKLHEDRLKEDLGTHHDTQHKTFEPLINLLGRNTDWHGLIEIAKGAPAEFIEQLWTWIPAISTEITFDREPVVSRYRDDYEWRLGEQFSGNLSQALWIAVSAFATANPDRFLRWTDQSETCEFLSVHKLIAEGLASIADKRAGFVVKYLLTDSRRLSLSGLTGGVDHSFKLLQAVGPALTEPESNSIIEKILTWDYYDLTNVEDPQRLAELRKYNEGRRLRLISSFPKARRARAILDPLACWPQMPEEHAGRIWSWGGMVKSPIDTEGMRSLSNSDIVAFLAEYPDLRESDLDTLTGGALEVANVFAEFAKLEAERATEIMCELRPGLQEIAAGHGLRALAGVESFDPSRLLTLASHLREKGFSSNRFDDEYAWAMVALAQRTNGLSDDTIRRLLAFLKDSSDVINERNREEDYSGPTRPLGNKKYRSILWDSNGGRSLPDGNFPILLAVTLGLLRREPQAYEQWLKILEDHLERIEDPGVWLALAQHLPYLAGTARPRALAFVENLLRKFPQIFDTIDGARFVAHSQWWFPAELFSKYLDLLDHSDWNLAPSAVGEMILLRGALVPEDEKSRKRYQDAVDSLEAERTDLQFGLVRSAAETWIEPRLRAESHRVLMTAISARSDEFIQPIIFAFGDNKEGQKLPSDWRTSEFLGAVGERPDLLKAFGLNGLTEHLKELLQDNLSPVEVAKFTIRLLDAVKDDISDVLSLSTDNLISIALTLQRHQDTRAEGTTIFEQLIISNAYGVDTAVRALDRKF
jgi:hypothetical protein